MNEFATESKSSVSVTANAKGDAQTSVKAYEGTEPDEMDRLSRIAVDTFLATRRRLAESGQVVVA